MQRPSADAHRPVPGERRLTWRLFPARNYEACRTASASATSSASSRAVVSLTSDPKDPRLRPRCRHRAARPAHDRLLGLVRGGAQEGLRPAAVPRSTSTTTPSAAQSPQWPSRMCETYKGAALVLTGPYCRRCRSPRRPCRPAFHGVPRGWMKPVMTRTSQVGTSKTTAALIAAFAVFRRRVPDGQVPPCSCPRCHCQAGTAVAGHAVRQRRELFRTHGNDQGPGFTTMPRPGSNPASVFQLGCASYRYRGDPAHGARSQALPPRLTARASCCHSNAKATSAKQKRMAEYTAKPDFGQGEQRGCRRRDRHLGQHHALLRARVPGAAPAGGERCLS